MKKKTNTRVNKSHILKLGSFRLHHKILFTCAGVIGVILIWRGAWSLIDQTPIINNPLISLLLGLFLVLLSGVFFKLI